MGGVVHFEPLEIKRASLTKLERAKMLHEQGYKCATAGCGGKPAIAEHVICVAQGNQEKPTCILCEACAGTKTKKDMADIAKGHRRAGRTGQYARLKRRGKSLVQSGKRQWPKRKFPKIAKKTGT